MSKPKTKAVKKTKHRDPTREEIEAYVKSYIGAPMAQARVLLGWRFGHFLIRAVFEKAQGPKKQEAEFARRLIALAEADLDSERAREMIHRLVGGM